MDGVKSRFWKNPREAIFCIVLVLLTIGCINVFSASQVRAETTFANSRFYLYRQSIFAMCGLVAMYACSHIDYRRWLRKADLLVIVTVALLVYVMFKGTTVGGAQRWLQIMPGLSFQPSELAKLTVVLLCGARMGRRLQSGRQGNLLSAPFFLSMVIGALVYIQPDLGTAAIIVALVLGLYFVCGLPKGQYVTLLVGLPALAIFLAVQASYRLERIRAWLDPWSYADRAGYQTVQAIMAIGSGGWTGTGMGGGHSKFYYLPEAHTDFSFAVLCQEWGFIGALSVIALFVCLSYILWKAADSVQDGHGYVIVMGANLLIAGQAVGNIAMVCGLLPVVGVPLPFISYGGTSLVVTMALLGIALNVIKKSPEASYV